jgi:hypothetical protein
MPAGISSTLGFTAGSWARMACAVAFAFALAAAIAVVEAMPVPSAIPERLSIEATAAVSRWLVLCDGVEVVGTSSERAWSASLPADAHGLSVEAIGAADAPLALRIVLVGRRTPIEHLAWGDGAARAEVALDHGAHHE